MTVVHLRCLGAVLAAGMLVSPMPGRAQTAAPPTPQADVERARVLFEQGLKLASDERWTEARAAFEQARSFSQRPSIVFNLASVLFRLDELTSAQRVLDDYERIAAPDDPSRPEAERLRGLIEAGIVRLVLTVEPAAAQVSIDDEVRDASGVERKYALDPGRHVLEVSAVGRLPQRVSFDAPDGSLVERHVALVASPNSAPAAALAADVDRDDEDGGGLLSAPWFWVAAGVVVLGAGAGVIVLASGADDGVAAPDRGSSKVLLMVGGM